MLVYVLNNENKRTQVKWGSEPELDVTVVSTRQLLPFYFGIREENSTKNIESTSFEWNLKQFEFSGSINPVDKLIYF